MYVKNYRDVKPLDPSATPHIGTYYPLITREMTRNNNFNVMVEKYDRKGHVMPHHHGEDAAYPNGEQCFFVFKGKARVRLGDEVKVMEEGEIVYVPMGVEHEVWAEAEEVLILTVSVWA